MSHLADVAAGRTALTHKALDDHPHQRAADYLRHMLVGSPSPSAVAAQSWLTSLEPGPN